MVDLKKALPLALLLVGGALLVAGLLPLVAKLLGYSLGGSIIDEIKQATDINPWVEKLLATAIGTVATLIYAYFNLRLSWTRQLIGMTLIGMMWMVTYGFLAWKTSDPIDGPWFTTTGEPLRCYVLEPRRVRLLYRVDSDPKTGARCHPVSVAMEPKLRAWLMAQRDADRGGQRLELRPVPKPTTYFDFAGAPVIWYHADQNAGCEFYEIPGRHPKSGDELKPITKEAVDWCEGRIAAVEQRQREERQRIARQQAEQSARKAAEERRAAVAEQEAARAQAAEQARQASILRYLGSADTRGAFVVAVANLDSLDSAALDVIGQLGRVVMLKPSFAADGVFDSVWSGGGELANLGLGNARIVLLLKPSSAPRSTHSPALQALTFVSQDFSVLVVKPSSSFLSRRTSFTAEGRAFDEAGARSALREDFKTKLRLATTVQ